MGPPSSSEGTDASRRPMLGATPRSGTFDATRHAETRTTAGQMARIIGTTIIGTTIIGTTRQFRGRQTVPPPVFWAGAGWGGRLGPLSSSPPTGAAGKPKSVPPPSLSGQLLFGATPHPRGGGSLPGWCHPSVRRAAKLVPPASPEGPTCATRRFIYGRFGREARNSTRRTN